MYLSEMTYRIGDETGYDDLSHFWSTGIGCDDARLACMNINEDEFRAACAVEGRKNLIFPGLACIRKIGYIFHDSLARKGGEVSEESSNDAIPRSCLFLVVRAMERKLGGFRSSGDVIIRILITVNFKIWSYHCDSWIKLLMATVTCVLGGSAFFSVTKWRRHELLDTFLVFFNPTLISFFHAGKLILFPICTSDLLSSSESNWWAFGVLMPLFLSTIASNITSGYSAYRWVLRLHQIFYVLMHVATYYAVLTRLTLVHSLLRLLILEHELAISVGRTLFMVIVLSFAISKDVLATIRSRPRLRALAFLVISISIFSCYRLLSGFPAEVACLVLILVVMLVAAPAPPERVQSALVWITLRILEVVEVSYLVTQTLMSAVLVCGSSPQLGLRFLMYAVPWRKRYLHN